MNRFSQKSVAAKLVAILFALMLAMMVGAGPVSAQDATPAPQVSVEAPSANAEVEQAELLTVNGVTVLSTDADIDESGWIQCRQVGGSQAACQGRVDRKLSRLGFDTPNWGDPDGAIAYMSGLYYENKPWKAVISFCTREMSAKWSTGACWVSTPTPTPPPTSTPTETPEPSPTATQTQTPEPIATGTQVPTATATATQQATATATAFNTPTATATATVTVQAPTVTPTRGDPWVGHTLTLGSFCSPEGESPIGNLPGEALSAHLKVQVGSFDGAQSGLWEADNGLEGWTETTELHFGEQPRVWDYSTSVTNPLVGWFFIDPVSGEIAQAAPDSALGFNMGGTHDDKRLVSLHDCQVVLAELQEATPVPTPAGEQSADLRGNGDGGGRPWGLIVAVSVSAICHLIGLIALLSRAKARKEEDNKPPR